MRRVGTMIVLALLATISSDNGAAVAQGDHKPSALHPDNPHYFLFRGKPTVIVTSAEHYGAVLNLDFDYVKYLDELAAHGLNNTRTWTGAYCEDDKSFNIARNTLAPAAGAVHLPLGAQRSAGLRQRRQQVRPDEMGRGVFQAAEGFSRRRRASAA